jgi:hypothetical protein
MAWPKGVSKKEYAESKSRTDGGFAIPEGASISVERRAKPSLADKRFDPANKFKTDPDHFYYRYIPSRPRERNMREAEGYQPIPGSEFGDLVLAKLPKEIQQENVAELNDKTERQTDATVNQFKEEARRMGVETFEEK